MRAALRARRSSGRSGAVAAFLGEFSARVRDAVRETGIGEPGGGWLAWARTPGAKWAFSGALLTLLLVAGVWEATAPKRVSRAPRAAGAVVAEMSPDAAGFDALESGRRPTADPQTPQTMLRGTS